MASQTRQAREAERKLSIQTLAIASISSAVAALVVSQFWKGGTAPAAAVTPVIVSLVSELLRKPTEAISARVTTERTAILPEGMGAGAPTERTEVATAAPARDFEGPKPAAQERPPPLRGTDGPVPSHEREPREPPVTYHRAGTNGRAGAGGGRLPVRVVAVTAALAVLIGAAILTIPELIAGDSLGKTSGGTTLFGGGKKSSEDGEERPDASQPQRNGSDQRDGRQDQPPSQGDRQDGPTEPRRTQPPDQTKQQTTPAPKTPANPQPDPRQSQSPPRQPQQAPATP